MVCRSRCDPRPARLRLQNVSLTTDRGESLRRPDVCWQTVVRVWSLSCSNSSAAVGAGSSFMRHRRLSLVLVAAVMTSASLPVHADDSSGPATVAVFSFDKSITEKPASDDPLFGSVGAETLHSLLPGSTRPPKMTTSRRSSCSPAAHHLPTPRRKRSGRQSIASRRRARKFTPTPTRSAPPSTPCSAVRRG